MKKETIALKLRSFDFEGLMIFAQRLHDEIQERAGIYPSPVPSLTEFQSGIDTMRGFDEAWGGKGNRGSTKINVALWRRAEHCGGYIKSYANYVTIMQPDNALAWIELGFALKKQPAVTGLMQAVRDLHQFIARYIRPGDIKLKWMRPLETPPSMVITYNVLRSEIPFSPMPYTLTPL